MKTTTVTFEEFHQALVLTTGVDNENFSKYIMRSRPEYVETTMAVYGLMMGIADEGIESLEDDTMTPVEKGKMYLEKYKHLLEDDQVSAQTGEKA